MTPIRITPVYDDLDPSRRTPTGVMVTGLAPVDRALLEVGSEKAAVRTAVRLFETDVATAKLLVRVARTNPLLDDPEETP